MHTVTRLLLTVVLNWQAISTQGAAPDDLSVPTPTVKLAIHDAGHARLQSLRTQVGVRWSIELGSELLLGLDPGALVTMRALPEFVAELGYVSRDDLMVAAHTCAEALPQRWAVVGGYELMRIPAPLQHRHALVHSSLRQLNTVPQVDASNSRHLMLARAQRNESGVQERSPLDEEIRSSGVASVVARVNAERWFQTMSELSGFNRNSFSPGLLSARSWIGEQFQDAGLQLSEFTFQMSIPASCNPAPPMTSLPNVIGTKPGLLLPNEWVVIGAHYDSRNPSLCDGAINPQPGANDNASGCAGVIELARVFQTVQTERSMLFMCFSGEEQGLVGSRRYVESLQASGDISKIKLMINLDMIGYDVNGLKNARIESTQASLLADLLAAGNTYSPELSFITSSTPNGGSDHLPFQQAGVPTAVTWENGAASYPHYHRSTDIPSNMTGAQLIAGGILKMDAAVLAARVGAIDLPVFTNGFE